MVTAPVSGRVNNWRNHVSSWSYKEGDSIRVSCFTNCKEAELFLNGMSFGKKQLLDTIKTITWKIAYQPGELSVHGYNNGTEAANYNLKTPGVAYSIMTRTDNPSFNDNKKKLTHIEIYIVDKNGVPVVNADNEISLKIEGQAKLSGLESGNPVSHEDYKSAKRKAYRGRLLAYIQSQQKGTIKITISSPGLQPATTQIQ